METTRQRVERYIKHDRSLASGVKLYGELPEKSIATERTLSRLPNLPSSIDRVCYNLAKLANIPERNLKILMQQKPVPYAAIKRPVFPKDREDFTKARFINPFASIIKNVTELFKNKKD